MCAPQCVAPSHLASSSKPKGSLLIQVDPLRSAWWVTQGGRNAFNRDRSCCCSGAFARERGADGIGAGERRGHRASRGRHGNGEPGPLLVHMARLARILPALALLVRGLQDVTSRPAGGLALRATTRRAGPGALDFFASQGAFAY